MNTKPLTAAALAGVLRPLLSGRQHGLGADHRQGARHHGRGDRRAGRTARFDSYIKLTVTTDEHDRAVAGTVFSDGRPRIIQIKRHQHGGRGRAAHALRPNADKPGFIGRFGTLLGEAGVNIATFALGRDQPGGDAICIVAIDEPVSDEVLARCGRSRRSSARAR